MMFFAPLSNKDRLTKRFFEPGKMLITSRIKIWMISDTESELFFEPSNYL